MNAFADGNRLKKILLDLKNNECCKKIWYFNN